MENFDIGIDYKKITLDQLVNYNFLEFICDGDKKQIFVEVEIK